MKSIMTAGISLLLIYSCNAQSTGMKQVGGPCEGCEALYEYGTKKLKQADTLPGYVSSTEPLKITGVIYEKDGRTPAKDVILYIYHTDSTGRYPPYSGASGWGLRHGALRGWIKTGPDGRYIFYSSKPAPYPGRTDPAHIHFTVKEPSTVPYYIDDIHFADDPLLRNQTKRQQPRGGDGIISLKREGNTWVAQRDIVLGLNIPDYKD